MTKTNISCQLHHRPDGEVFGKMIGENGQVLDTIYIGKLTDKQFEQLFEVIRQQMPVTTVADIEFSGN